ncbi:MAG: APC family permease [Moorellales bacterium]
MALKRVLTLPTIVSTSAGLTFATSCFIAATQVAYHLAGNAAWLAILVAGVLCLLAAGCFSELNGMLPSAAGIRLYFARAFSERVAITTSLVYMGVVASVIGAESYVLSQVLVTAFPWFPALGWIVVLQALVTGLNLRGVRLAGRFQDIVTYSLVLSLLFFGLLALGRQGFSPPHPFTTGGPDQLVQAIAVGVFLFIGFEWVTPLAEEVTEIRLISRGMFLAIGVLSVTYAIFTVAMSSTADIASLAASPVPQLLFARKLLGPAGMAWMVGLSVAASVTTFNAGLLSLSRFVYSTAREHVLPSALARISRRYFTPWAAILAVFAFALPVSLAVYLTRSYLVLVNVGAATEALVYVLAGLAVWSLRRREPQTPRPYRLPGGGLVPWLTVAVFGILAAAVLSQDRSALVYLLLAAAGCGLYVVTVVPRLKQRAQARRRAARARATEAPVSGRAGR